VVVEATSAEAQSEEFWRSESDSPLSRADAGTLVLLNVVALPLATQDVLAIELSNRIECEGAGLMPTGLVATVVQSSHELTDSRLLSRALATFLLHDVVRLPTLMERPEDLRALVLDRLCLSGVRFERQALGIEPQALSILLDYHWPGNDAELKAVVERAARVAVGPRVTADDLAAAGFAPPIQVDSQVSTIARPSRPRAPTPADASVSTAQRATQRRRRRR
jgi:DNA-binding NtrC family response regulator